MEVFPSIPEEELDTGFLSANDNNDLYDIDNIDKPVEQIEFEEDSRSFEQRLKSLERDRGSVSTQLVSINNELDTMENLQPKSIDEIKREKYERDLQEKEFQERELREKYKELEASLNGLGISKKMILRINNQFKINKKEKNIKEKEDHEDYLERHSSNHMLTIHGYDYDIPEKEILSLRDKRVKERAEAKKAKEI